MISADSVCVTSDSIILVPSEESTPDHVLVENIALLGCSIFAIIFVLLALWAACISLCCLLL
jgi:hypothetical protein